MNIMRICVSIPSISYEDVKDNEVLKSYFIEDVLPFELPKESNLDIFRKEIGHLEPHKLFGINIPNFPLEAKNAKGVAGPGKPIEELFVPLELEDVLKPLCGSYDKWRPYPAEDPLLDYSKQMAKKFTHKRCKIFHKAGRDFSWDLLFYVEHSPASLAHLDKKFAIEITENVFKNTIKICREWPAVPVVIFSPYGTNNDNGFIISNNVPNSSCMTTWEHIRGFINGDERHPST